jgi:hypothetical protein
MEIQLSHRNFKHIGSTWKPRRRSPANHGFWTFGNETVQAVGLNKKLTRPMLENTGPFPRFTNEQHPSEASREAHDFE